MNKAFFVGGFALLLVARNASAQQAEILPVDQVRPGQTGYGLTVFSGFKVERFKVRVIDVLHNFLPKQDIILISMDHPRLHAAKIVGGMSGSPIFIEGKLVGALAYGWRFSRDPVAGVTPIKNMLELLQYKRRGPELVAQDARRRPVDRLALAALSRRDRWWRPELPRKPRPASARELLTRVNVPLNVAGFATGVMPRIREAFTDYGFEPVQGGGTGKVDGPTSFTPGSALGVQLVSGDMSMASTGTVTWTRGKDVLAFGHPGFNAGEIYLPVVSARVALTFASLSRSFKISSPARVLGSLVQDRQAAIHADTSVRVTTVPMTVKLRWPGGSEVFHTQLARHRLLTGSLAQMVAASALSKALADVDRVTFTIRTRITAKGLPPVKFEEHHFSPAGVRQAGVFFSRGLAAIRVLLANDFAPVHMERIDQELEVRFNQEVVEITGLRMASSIVEPGARVNLVVSFRPYGGAEFTKTYPLEIPRSMAGSVVLAEVASGTDVRPELAPPQNLPQLIANLETMYSGRSLVLSLYTPAIGIKLNGQVIPDLPDSVIDSLNSGSKIRNEQAFKSADRKVFGTQRVIAGKRQIRIRVKSEGE